MLSGRGGLKSISVMAILFAMVELRYAATDFARFIVPKTVVAQSVPKINATRVRAKSRGGTVGSARAAEGFRPTPQRPFATTTFGSVPISDCATTQFNHAVPLTISAARQSMSCDSVRTDRDRTVGHRGRGLASLVAGGYVGGGLHESRHIRGIRRILGLASVPIPTAKPHQVEQYPFPQADSGLAGT
jgi:hypothetical protein